MFRSHLQHHEQVSYLLSTHPHRTLEEAESEADRLAAQTRGADVMIFDTTDPSDLPDWAT